MIQSSLKIYKRQLIIIITFTLFLVLVIIKKVEVQFTLVLEDTFIIAEFSKSFSHVDILLLLFFNLFVCLFVYQLSS